MNLEDQIKEILFTEEEIKAKVVELAAEIEDYYGKRNSPLLVVGILKGAVVFLTDLIREIKMPVKLDFMDVSSYGMGRTESTGAVRILKDLEFDIEGMDVLIVEDIVDTGNTLSYLGDIMLRRGANSVKVASLLSKPSRRKEEVKIDFLGFKIPDEFVIGYGIDYSEVHRNLPYIAALDIDSL